MLKIEMQYKFFLKHNSDCCAADSSSTLLSHSVSLHDNFIFVIFLQKEILERSLNQSEGLNQRGTIC